MGLFTLGISRRLLYDKLTRSDPSTDSVSEDQSEYFRGLLIVMVLILNMNGGLLHVRLVGVLDSHPEDQVGHREPARCCRTRRCS